MTDRTHIADRPQSQRPARTRNKQPPHAEAAGSAGPRSTHDGGASFEAELRSAPQDEEERSSGTAPKDGFVAVQYLRGIAAFAVMYYHIFANRIAAPWHGGSQIGLWGVDLFFVVSGFIMWRSSGSGSVSPGDFIRRRALRVYPLWWLVLTAWILVRLAVPDSLHNADVDARTVLLSYLLVPHLHAVYAGMAWPVLTVGWTLQLEIFFYAVFALVMALAPAHRRLAALLTALAALTLLGLATGPAGALASTYTSALLLEFAAGIALGAALDRIRSLPAPAGAALIAIGIALAVAGSGAPDLDRWRPLALGVPAVLAVAGCLALEERLRTAPNRLLLALGNASYSLYLTHPLAISAAAVLWSRLGLPAGEGLASLGFIPVAALSAVAVALLCYRFVEKPLLAAASRRRAPGRRTDARPAAVASPT